MRVALVHDYLNQYGGAERVLEALHELFPAAPVYTSIFDPATMPVTYQQWDIRTSFMQRLPAWRTQFRRYVALYPTAFERFDLSNYDLIISSSSAFAKGVIPRPGALHICYCHTPMRFAWRTGDYVAREQINGFQAKLLPFLLNYLRIWDTVSANRVDLFVANSREVAGRIARYYRRPAIVIPPPVDLPPYEPRPPAEFYLAGGRLIPYKRLELVIEAFNRLRLPLKIFGDGRDRSRLERMAGPNIEFLGWVDEATRLDLFARCRAFIFPGEEDFGITPLEVLAVGRPVIAYAAGGALETLIEGVTGRFFYQPTAAALAAAVALSRTDPVDSLALRRHAERFSRERFLAAMRAFIDEALAAQRAGQLATFEQSLLGQGTVKV
ncbi:glycosyltransferase [Chloroflexus sp.]|uniref:glycosyltransferase n=1 Tax=Chloroflexus sp. TaxID=1904827 RepID=UPI00298F29B6|nr:glycosyltransferase [Chloroflexus sp.]MDW8405466.1 glycosyltransferase [Chloroflexus sp.]